MATCQFVHRIFPGGILTAGLKPLLSLLKSCGLGAEPVFNRLVQTEQGIYSRRDGDLPIRTPDFSRRHLNRRVETLAQLAEVLRTESRAGFQPACAD
jgi:hypothetical protein